ncbi:hypothetical protein ACFX1S_046255 [Malus domestica]
MPPRPKKIKPKLLCQEENQKQNPSISTHPSTPTTPTPRQRIKELPYCFCNLSKSFCR